MIRTTAVEPHKVTAYHGVDVDQAIIGANIMRDVFARITDRAGHEHSAGDVA